MRNDFYTASNVLIGYTVESGSTVVGVREDVYDSNGFYLGYTDDSGTYNEAGGKVSSSKAPGLLFPRPKES